MREERIQVTANIDARTFREFALFDNLYRRRRWVSPAVFAGILLLAACGCFALRDRAEQAVLLGAILLAVGFGLPVVYFLSFFYSIRKQIKILGLKQPKAAYCLSLSSDGIEVRNERERAMFQWPEVYRVYRVRRCIYLYVTAFRAYLLPNAEPEEEASALWALFSEMLPAQKVFDLRR